MYNMFRFCAIFSRFAHRTNLYRVVHNCISRRHLQLKNTVSVLPHSFPPIVSGLPLSAILPLCGISLVNDINNDETQMIPRLLKAVKNGNVSKVSRQLKSRKWDPNERYKIDSYFYFIIYK